MQIGPFLSNLQLLNFTNCILWLFYFCILAFAKYTWGTPGVHFSHGAGGSLWEKVLLLDQPLRLTACPWPPAVRRVPTIMESVPGPAHWGGSAHRFGGDWQVWGGWGFRETKESSHLRVPSPHRRGKLDEPAVGLKFPKEALPATGACRGFNSGSKLEPAWKENLCCRFFWSGLSWWCTWLCLRVRQTNWQTPPLTLSTGDHMCADGISLPGTLEWQRRGSRVLCHLPKGHNRGLWFTVASALGFSLSLSCQHQEAMELGLRNSAKHKSHILKHDHVWSISNDWSDFLNKSSFA